MAFTVLTKDFGKVDMRAAASLDADGSTVTGQHSRLSTYVNGVSKKILSFGSGIYRFNDQCVLSGVTDTIFEGQGGLSTIFQLEGTAASYFLLMGSNLEFHGIAFDFAGLNQTGGAAFHVYGPYFGGTARFKDCTFFNCDNSTGIFVNQAAYDVDSCQFLGTGGPGPWTIGGGVQVNGGSGSGRVIHSRFEYIYLGVLMNTGGATNVAINDTAEHAEVSNNYFDQGWWLLKTRQSGKNGVGGHTVSYTANTVTDNLGAFTSLSPAITSEDTVRITLPIASHNATGVDYEGNTLIDASAPFVAANIQKGYIVRTTSGTSKWTVVQGVESTSVLRVEQWRDSSTYRPTAPPQGVGYELLKVWLGHVTSIAATSITVGTPKPTGWHDFNGAFSTPDSTATYEILPTHPSYHIQCSWQSRKVDVSHNDVRRGWGDQITVQGYEYVVADNLSEDCFDTGISAHGRYGLIHDNRLYHNGGCGIISFQNLADLGAGRNIEHDNYSVDHGWCSDPNPYLPAYDFFGDHIAHDNVAIRVDSEGAKTGFAIVGASTGNGVYNDNFSQNMLVADVGLDTDTDITSAAGRFQKGATFYKFGAGLVKIVGEFSGSSSPESLIYADIGSRYWRTDGILWTKKSGVGTNTGWVADTAGVVVTLTDAATVATNAALGTYFKLSAGASRTMGAPTNGLSGQEITYDILNNTGGAITTTWNGAFKLAGAWVDPATTKRRVIAFTYDGTNWVEKTRVAADI